jgi:Tol biopolymer transport system component
VTTKTWTAIGALLPAATLLLGGCTAGSSTASPVNVIYRPPAKAGRAVTLNDSADPARHAAQPATRPASPDRRAATSGHTVQFSQAAPAPPATPVNRRAVTPVGLFGERISGPAASGGSYDGGINLAPVSFATEGTCFDPDVDRSGRWLVFASTTHAPTADIYLKSTSGRTLTQITKNPADDVMPTFSPDGRGIAFASNRGGNWDIFITSVDGGLPTQVTSDTDHEVHPSWSPDGRRVAFSKYGAQSGRWEIWVVDLERPGVSRFLEYGLFPKWSPDIARGKILFQRARQRGSRYHSIWTIDYVNGEAMHPTEIISAANAALINPAWSPDGRRIVFTSVLEPEPGTPPQQAQIWMVNLDGTGRTNLIGGRFANTQPVWSGDGNVYFVSNRSGVDNIWAATVGRSALDPFIGGDTGIANVDPDAARSSD